MKRKALMVKILALEKNLLVQRRFATEHKNYLLDTIKNHQAAVICILLPVLLWGWKKGRTICVSTLLKQVTQLGMLTFFPLIKRLLKDR